MAQSAYGCQGLGTHAALPAVEGADGVFFRIRPDLQTHQGLADVTIARIATLSKALAARGTTLIFMPVPARAQVLAHKLPAAAKDVGYDPDIAWAVRRDVQARMEAAGIRVANPRLALRRATLAGTNVFFGTDPRPTTDGMKIMARVLADVLATDPDTKGLPRAAFTTTKGATDTALPSAMRAQLQLACQDALPAVRTERFGTVGAIAAEVATTGVVAVIGTEMTGTPVLNFSGFLSEFSGLRAGSYGVDGGGAFAAMSSYLTSVDFQAAPPQILVWEAPVWTRFGDFGDQPMAELIAAASQTCTTSLSLQPGSAANRRTADLNRLQTGQPVVLELDTDGVGAGQVTFHFTSADGQTRSRSIYRHPDQVRTGRFYLSLSGLEQTGLRHVDIELPEAFGPQPRLSACLQGSMP
ncbi:MAG: hypothetical protein WBB25_09415 [Sulfitobacter sp.]